MIPYGRQDISEADIAAVVDVLRSDWLTQGPAGPAFEQALCQYVSAPHCVTVSNATAGLHLAYLALGLKPAGLVWTPPNTFVATANAALYCGADIDFVDVDPNTYCMSVDLLEAKLAQAERTGARLPDIVTMVHFAGQSVGMPRLNALGKQYGFKIVEDASHAIGADVEGGKVGDCRFSDISVFSFHPVKIITTGEGGALMTCDPELAVSLAQLRSHGITRDHDRMMSASEGSWYYQQISLGFNYRMTDMQAALGLSQLQRIDPFIAHRRALAVRYNQLLAGMPVTCPWQSPEGQSTFHLYPICVGSGYDRATVFEAMRKAGIGVNVHYIPVHLQPVYLQRGFNRGDYPQAEAYYDSAITLPLYASMTFEQQDQVVAALQASLGV